MTSPDMVFYRPKDQQLHGFGNPKLPFCASSLLPRIAVILPVQFREALEPRATKQTIEFYGNKEVGMYGRSLKWSTEFLL
jgi:hypothetical protein